MPLASSVNDGGQNDDGDGDITAVGDGVEDSDSSDVSDGEGVDDSTGDGDRSDGEGDSSDGEGVEDGDGSNGEDVDGECVIVVLSTADIVLVINIDDVIAAAGTHT